MLLGDDHTTNPDNGRTLDRPSKIDESDDHFTSNGRIGAGHVRAQQLHLHTLAMLLGNIVVAVIRIDPRPSI